jgi:CBS domain-containing protein
LDNKGEVVGIFTARDIIRHIHLQPNKFLALQSRISTVMTEKQKLVYCSPEDSVDKCKKIMFQLKIRNIPVIENGEILGRLIFNTIIYITIINYYYIYYYYILLLIYYY